MKSFTLFTLRPAQDKGNLVIPLANTFTRCLTMPLLAPCKPKLYKALCMIYKGIVNKPLVNEYEQAIYKELAGKPLVNSFIR